MKETKLIITCEAVFRENRLGDIGELFMRFPRFKKWWKFWEDNYEYLPYKIINLEFK